MSDATLAIHAGPHDRRHCPVAIPWDGHAPEQLVCEGTGEVVPCQVSDGMLWAVFPRLAAGVTSRWRPDHEPAALAAGVRLERDDERTAVTCHADGAPLTTFYCGSELFRPFLHPLYGPDGARLTRFYPTERRDGETDDHPHHRGLWTAYGDVNGVDHWLEKDGCGTQRCVGFDACEDGPVLGRVVARIEWRRPDGAVQIAERRTMRAFATSPTLRILDFESELTAMEGDVRFGDTKEGGLCAVRVATPMDADRGGRIENACGGVGEAECWGEPAHWCDYSGTVDGARAGIAVLDHPSSFRHPTPWHVRAYGLMGANPFAHSFYQKGHLPDGSWMLPRGETLPFRYRVILHAGDAREAGIAERYHDYVHPPVAELEPGSSP